jgi:hypothetical protein
MPICKRRMLELVFICSILGAAGPMAARAQSAKIDIESLARLGDKASEVIDVTLDDKMIQLAAKFLSNQRSPDEAKLKEIVSKLKGVYVRRLEFDKEGEYSQADIGPILTQLGIPAWTQIVGVTSKTTGEYIRVYVMNAGDAVQGLAILAAEPKELTVVNIVGPIDIEKISALEGNFGIPKLNLETKKPENAPEKPPGKTDNH